MKQPLTYQQKLSKKIASDQRARAKFLAKPRKLNDKNVRRGVTALKRLGKASKRPVERSKPKKRRKGSTDIKKAKTKLWELCKQLTRKTYGNTCYTCGKKGLAGSSWQTGHFIASSIGGTYLRYDLRNLRPQCYRCNIDFSGNGAVFYRLLVGDCGQEYVDELFRDKERIVKADLPFYLGKIAEYEKLLITTPLP